MGAGRAQGAIFKGARAGRTFVTAGRAQGALS
jgi:hypothetical protein